MDAKPQPLQVDDRIDDRLPRTVVRHVAPAVGVHELDAGGPKERLVRQHMLARALPPRDRHHRRMLDQEHPVRYSLGPPFHERSVPLALQGKRVRVGHAAKPLDLEWLVAPVHRPQA